MFLGCQLCTVYSVFHTESKLRGFATAPFFPTPLLAILNVMLRQINKLNNYSSISKRSILLKWVAWEGSVKVTDVCGR